MYRTPAEVKKDKLVCGEVGWISASIKSIQNVHVGDTITTLENESHEQLPGYRKVKSYGLLWTYIQLIILSIKIYEKHWKKYNLSDSSLVI